jgi:hypothetical protein
MEGGMVGHAVCMAEINIYNISAGKLEKKRSLGRRTCGWDKCIKMDMKETGNEDMQGSHVIHDRYQLWAFMNTVMKLRAP